MRETATILKSLLFAILKEEDKNEIVEIVKSYCEEEEIAIAEERYKKYLERKNKTE